MNRLAPQRWLAWTFVAVLAVSCALLGALQYRWIGEITEAERDRLRDSLRSRLNAFERAFDGEIATAANALVPDPPQHEDPIGREAEWRSRYTAWRQSHPAFFRTIALVYPSGDELRSLPLEPAGPPASVSHDVLRQENTGVLVQEVFGQPAGPIWLLLRLNEDYIAKVLASRLIGIYLGDEGALDYAAEIVSTGTPARVIYRSGSDDPHELQNHADASVSLLNFPLGGGRGRPGSPFARGRGPEFRPPPPRGFLRQGRRGPPPGENGRGLYQLSVRHRAGSLEALVAGTQRRNLAVSGGVLLLIVIAAGLLLAWSRNAQRLAALQMEFVAGVSHELRTPLTVIRTAAYNLRSAAIRSRPEHVEKYGNLIESESTRLEKMMEQVLRFASLNAGHPLSAKESFNLARAIQDEIELRRADLERDQIALEENIGDLPPVRGDEDALRHVIRNLIDNALKHGAAGKWIGISAHALAASDRNWVELRVADHGPGVPSAEQKRIFDAFYRGSEALKEQIRGNGLGLSLARMVTERHGGSIRVQNNQQGGAEFILRLPA